jgi:hypothetical protein
MIKSNPSRIILLTVGILLSCSCSIRNAHVFPKEFEVISPDSNITVNFTVGKESPYYSVFYGNKSLIKPSSMGFQFKNASPLNGNLKIIKIEREIVDEIWKPLWGTTDEIRNQYNQLTIELNEDKEPYREMILVFRIYNDGLGFRYILPDQKNLGEFNITSEDTKFRFAGDYKSFWIPADYDSYEHLYNETPISEIDSANTPITMETEDGLYLSIHEANLTDYAGMTLKRVEGEPYTLKCNLVPWSDGIKVKGRTPHSTPWRTIQIGREPGDLIESNLILNLNDPCVLEDVSWIEPGTYVGIWWEMHIGKSTWSRGPSHGATTENAKHFIDFASKHKIPALLIEGWNAGWEENWKGQDFTTPTEDYNLPEVVRYGREHGVKIIAHNETGGDALDYETQIDEAFSLYEKLGMPGVKTGYAGSIIPEGQHHHGQWMVNHYRKVIKKAAEHHLMIDAHEPIKPTGIRRTYPNFMTREGVRGMEFNAWSEGNPPEHTTILPFTRMLAGPLDYTPGIFDITFDKYRKDYRAHTTRAKQLALYPILFSGLQMIADLPENYEGQVGFEFLTHVPASWNETIVLNGKIGDYVTIARRCKGEWYIGSITDENPRKFRLPLNFLDTDRKYLAQIYSDGADAHWEHNPWPIDVKEFIVTSRDTLIALLAAGGGQAIRLIPASRENIENIPEY